MKSRLDLGLPSLLFLQFREFILYYILALLCLVGTHGVQSELPFIAKQLADLVTKGAGAIPTGELMLLALGIVFFRTSSRLLFFYPARVMQKNLRVELLHRLESASPLRYRQYSDGQLFQTLGADMEEIRAMVGFALLQVFNMIVASAILLPRLMSFNSQLVPALIPLVIAFFFFLVVVGSSRQYFRKTQDMQGELQNFIMESYAGKKTIKNYHAEGSFLELFKKYSFAELLNFYKAGKRISFSVPLVPLGVGACLIWGAIVIREQNLGASSLILFSGFIFLFLEPLMFLSWIGIVFTRSHGAWSRIKELVRALDRPTETEIKLKEINLNGDKLQFNLLFWNENLLVKINPGTWHIFVGKTGHGKSEIVQQMSQIIFEKGECPSLVLQEPYLYNSTIEENIFLGKEESERDYDLASELLTLFGLEILEVDMKALFKLEIGENGKTLSGGQAKRLCLVRSLILCGDIVIWDDPFSSVDVIQERAIVEALRKNKNFSAKTFILTGHRLSTVRLCDEVTLVSKNEGIIQSGLTANLLTWKESKVYDYFQNQMV